MKITHGLQNRLHGLDHLRALAIVLVMIFHFGKGIPSWLEPFRQMGWSGVDLFFVLSGFLIGYQLLKEIDATKTISFRRFYLKRFFRIIPAYLFVLAIYFSMPDFIEGKGLPPLWRFLTFTQNFGLDAGSQNSFSHAWSLCIEEQFYFVLPILIVLFFTYKFQKAFPFLILGLLVLGFVLRTVNWQMHVQPFIDGGQRYKMTLGFIETIYYPTYNRLDGLAFGLCIAALAVFKPKFMLRLSKYGNHLFVLGFMLLVAAYFWFNQFISFRTAVFGFPVISLAYALIVLAAINPSCILYKMQSKTTYLIATLSYAIYLSHKQIFYLTRIALESFGIEIPENRIFWIAIFMACLFGLFLHLIVEKPFLQLRAKILQNKGFMKNV